MVAAKGQDHTANKNILFSSQIFSVFITTAFMSMGCKERLSRIVALIKIDSAVFIKRFIPPYHFYMADHSHSRGSKPFISANHIGLLKKITAEAYR